MTQIMEQGPIARYARGRCGARKAVLEQKKEDVQYEGISNTSLKRITLKEIKMMFAPLAEHIARKHHQLRRRAKVSANHSRRCEELITAPSFKRELEILRQLE